MGIIWTIIVGFVAGIIAKFLMPGDNEPSGFVLTTILGIVGAFVATFLGQSLGWYRPGEGAGLIGAVVGATYPEQLAELRQAMPHTWFLIPGFGAQGGTAKDCAAAFDANGLGAIINNSRGIIFAHSRPEYRGRSVPSRWQEAVDAATREMIAQLRAETASGRLPTN
jgi:orotidine-5'-phosphate decarboxylase